MSSTATRRPWAGGGWVVVSGGSGGIGSAICRELAAQGAHILFTYRSRRVVAEQVRADLLRDGVKAEAVQLDLSDSAAAAELFGRFRGTADLAGVVYASGPHITMDYASRTPPDRVRSQLENDTMACFNLFQPSLEHVRARPGALVAISTPAVRRFPKRDLLSSLPKAAVEAMVRGMAAEEGRYGVRVNAVAAGLIEAGMWQELNASGDYNERALAEAKARIPLPRLGTAEDIAGAVVFLLSEKAAWITGQTLCVDGGYSV